MKILLISSIWVTLLTACGKDEGEHSATSNCSKEEQPVCSIEKGLSYSFHVPPLPSGIYRTVKNRCTADALELQTIFEGECGEKEGLHYVEEPKDCTGEPVREKECAAVASAMPCADVPCPKYFHKTTNNRCERRNLGWPYAEPEACGEREGQEKLDIFRGNCHTPSISGACSKVYEYASCDEGICKQYTYENTSILPCYSLRKALALLRDCEDLEGIEANPYIPVQVFAGAGNDSFLPFSKVTVRSAEFIGDTLQVQLEHFGCKPQQFDLMLFLSLKQQPATTKARFIPYQIDNCFEQQLSELTFDTAPLKSFIKGTLGSDVNGSIEIDDLGAFSY